MRRNLYYLVVALAISVICMVGYNLYLAWIFSELLMTGGFGAPDAALYLGSIIRNGILIIMTSVTVTVLLELLRVD